MTNKLDRAYIGGQWLPISGRHVPLVDPASEAVTGQLVLSDRADVDKSVAAARRAFDQGWGASLPEVRLTVLHALLDGMSRRQDDFAKCISAEIGTPVDFAREGQVVAALGHLRATIAAMENSAEDRALSTDPEHRVRYEPLGVAALITPWNWPLNQVVLKLAAALAAGCSMVLKPSELSTRTALLLAEVVAELDIPDGVVNVLPGDGVTGADLVSHPDVDVVSFTGSTATGRAIATQAAGHFKRTTLELGGKSANILFSDCDLQVAIKQGVAHCFRNAGQSCNAASRMLVAREVYDEAMERAADAAVQTKVDLPSTPGVHIGPLVSGAQFDRVQGLIRAGIEQGARCIAGGPGRADGFNSGYFARPTVLADVTREMTVFHEEIFGPVLTMTPFDSEDEAIALANATDYGLSGYVQTPDPARADRVARALRVGMVQVNGTSREEGAPFGGRGQSGWGRESGLWGIRAFQDVKSISGARFSAL